jgi:hypothetical protein
MKYGEQGAKFAKSVGQGDPVGATKALAKAGQILNEESDIVDQAMARGDADAKKMRDIGNVNWHP